MATLRDFLFDSKRVSEGLRKKAEKLASNWRVGRCDQFGYFIFDVDKGKVVWVEQYRMLLGQFKKLIAKEDPIEVYEKTVYGHKNREKEEKTPRLILDKFLQKSGIEPGDTVVVEINTVTGRMVITPTKEVE